MYFFSISLGILVKCFDEIMDLNLEVPEFYIELIKGSILFLFFSLGYSDFNFSVSFFVVFLASYLAGGIDTSFWKITTVLLGFLSLVSYKPLDTLLKIPLMLIMPVLVYLEAKMFPEEQSLNKILNRIGTSGFFSLIFVPQINSFLTTNFGDIQFGEKQILSVIGYYSVSICVQIYNLYINPQVENNQQPKTEVSSHKQDQNKHTTSKI
jgi:hypothetical protein